MGRGQLTPEVQAKAVELLGRKVTLKELKLMRDYQRALLDVSYFDRRPRSGEDCEVLDLWESEGCVVDMPSEVMVTKDFWDVIHEILFLAYVRFR